MNAKWEKTIQQKSKEVKSQFSQISKKAIAVLTSAILVTSMTVGFGSTTAFAVTNYGSGAGTAANPYIISTGAQLAAIPTTGLSKCYKLAADIDLSSYSSWNPIGTKTSPFTGTFDGGNHKITGFAVESSSIQDFGLFGAIGSNGIIENLGVDGNVKISITSTVGILANQNYGTIANCFATGTVSSTGGSSTVGGLVGYNESFIYNSYCTAAVTGTAYVGGIYGSGKGTVINCYTTGNLTGGSSGSVGALSGYSPSGTFTNCYWNSDAAQTLGSTPRASSALLGIGNASNSAATGTQKTSAEMKLDTFRELLNTNRSSITGLASGLIIEYWASDTGSTNGGYPTLLPAPATPKVNGAWDDQYSTSFTKDPGSTLTIKVSASVTDGGTLSYQWQKCPNGGNWANIDGATSASYTTNALTYSADNNSQYRCVVTNTKNEATASATSDTASLTIIPALAPKIDLQPKDTSAASGHIATFTVGASTTDGGTLTYQWYKIDSNHNYLTIDGATGASYTTGSLSDSDDGTHYYCKVTNNNNGGKSMSESRYASLTILANAKAPAVSKPSDVTTDIGSTATFTVSATTTDNGFLSYQWQSMPTSNGTWTNIEGATKENYTTAALEYSDNGTQYRCIVTNSKNDTTANTTTLAATLTVNPAAIVPFVTGPADVTKNIGITATFTVSASATDNGFLSYQWQSMPGNGTWTNIEGATKENYTTAALEYSDNGTQYRCVVTNSKNDTTAAFTSSAATLTVNPPAVTPTITNSSDITKTATAATTATNPNTGSNSPIIPIEIFAVLGFVSIAAIVLNRKKSDSNE